jgi:hypothetical protein
MISDAEIERVTNASAKFKPALLGARYHADSDRIELKMSWCTLLIDRRQIAELRDVSPHDLENITVSPVGLHVHSADIDINAGGLLAFIADKLGRQAEKSL